MKNLLIIFLLLFSINSYCQESYTKTLPDGGFEKSRLQYYLDSKGYLHNDLGPAVVLPSGDSIWFNHGYIYRENGPAIVNRVGQKYWFVNPSQTIRQRIRLGDVYNLGITERKNPSWFSNIDVNEYVLLKQLNKVLDIYSKVYSFNYCNFVIDIGNMEIYNYSGTVSMCAEIKIKFEKAKLVLINSDGKILHSWYMDMLPNYNNLLCIEDLSKEYPLLYTTSDDYTFQIEIDKIPIFSKKFE